MKKLIFALMALGTSVALARPYGEAGCGFGSVLVGKDGNQIIAATTNNSSYTQLSGISSGTSNCVEDGVAKLDKQLPLFIETNREVLATDVARGQGETLAGLSQILGCSPATLNPALRKSYNKIFVDTGMDPAGIQSEIHSIAKDPNSCGV